MIIPEQYDKETNGDLIYILNQDLCDTFMISILTRW
jgi:hypothetical protein